MSRIYLLLFSLIIGLSVSECLANTHSYGLILASKQNESPTPIGDFVSVTKMKSPSKAFFYSTVVPGSGHLYLGKKRGFGYIISEIAFLSAYFVLHGRAEDLRSDYVNYVDEHIAFEPDSPTKTTEKWTLEDYEHATQADNWHYVYTDNAGKPIDRVGKFYWKDLPEDMIHENGEVPLSESNSKYRVIAYGKRGSANTKYKQAKIYLSMIVVNHVVSAIDARITAIIHNKKATQTASSIHIQPTLYINDNPEIRIILSSSY